MWLSKIYTLHFHYIDATITSQQELEVIPHLLITDGRNGIFYNILPLEPLDYGDPMAC